ncbi:DUF2971 domain-containing protein [Rhizobium sp. NZLR1]|uniref:DUF2971 domain-containing protein n=1 Tax=Rhizobium sp. NZLR1 TaxID=2731096 RepID=UPI001A999769|nr:DUF2971 domain-containing protein [Rhizobium sp. NZLR1]MBX5201987.1 DUF2971 domain-containing protein [Rhizobium sp. NZLR1]QSZ24203.1 DUF2971 domain-containing protein [Rhizobium sp. NZLR1]
MAISRKTKTSGDITVKKSSPDTKTPTHLTHYTDLSGLKGIIENNELWLSHAAFLNDPQELEHGVEQTKRVLNNLLDGKAVGSTAKARQKLIKDIADDMENFERPAAYIACLCERSDILSQWRGYASRQGVSVTFRMSGLRSCFSDLDAELLQVAYGINEAKRHLRTAIAEKFPDIVDDFDYMLGTEEDDAIRRKFKDLLATLVPRFKHYGFREEQEWRLVVRNPPIDKLKFRPRGQLMLPYLELKSKKKKLPISAVRIGPGVNDEAVQKSIRFFLEARGYDPDLVEMSSTPYRT